MSVTRLLSRQWWKTTLLVIAAVGVMIRLGIWQLDRLDQRRAFNQRVLTQQTQPTLDLNQDHYSVTDLAAMEYRQVTVTGEYDPDSEVVLRNQVWNNQIGVHVLTPLRLIGGDRSILIDRGWVPLEDFNSGRLKKYTEPGQVAVKGVIRRPATKPRFAGRADPVPQPGEERITAWNYANIPAIASQVPYPVLPVYIQQSPDPAWTSIPHRSQPDLELTEGPHLGYAMQWFAFALILAIGYPIYVKREEHRASTQKKKSVYVRPVSKSHPER